MFNIHMARVPWNPAARALALDALAKLYKGIAPDRLSEITGMREQDIVDANRILSFPKDIVSRCLREGQPDYLRPSNLIEMAKALEQMEEYLPEFFKEFDKEEVMRIYVNKRDKRIIRRNTDFRLIKDILSSLPAQRAQKLIVRTLREPDTGIADVYELVEDQIMSKRFDLFKKACTKFLSILQGLDPRALDKTSKKHSNLLLRRIRDTIDHKMQD